MRFTIRPFKNTNQITSSTKSLKADRGLRSRFNLDEYHEDDDVGPFLPLDDALLNRNCATALPAETVDEQATDGVS